MEPEIIHAYKIEGKGYTDQAYSQVESVVGLGGFSG